MLRVTKIKPMFNGIITTANKYPKNMINEKGIIDAKRSDTLKEYQTVLEVGPIASKSGINPGDIVMLNYMPYYRIKHQNGKYNTDDNTIEDVAIHLTDVPTFDIYNKDKGILETVLCLFDRDVVSIVEGDDLPDKVASPEDAIEAAALSNSVKSIIL